MVSLSHIEVRHPDCRSSGEVATERDGSDDEDRSVSACSGGNGRCDFRENVGVHREEVRGRDRTLIHSAFSGDLTLPEMWGDGGKVRWIVMSSKGRALKVQIPGAAWIVYVVRCRDRSLYTGIATDLERRLRQHNSGTASRYTRSRLPVKLVHREPSDNRSTASKREAAIKAMTRREKLALIRSKMKTR